MKLERMCDSIKSYTKKALVTGVLFGSVFVNPGCDRDTAYNKKIILNPLKINIDASAVPSRPFLDANDIREPFFDADELDEINKLLLGTDDSIKKNLPFITTIYGEAEYYKGNANENPVLLNIMTSYNIFNKSPDEGALLLNGRVLVKGDKSENFWNNCLDIEVGIAYKKDSFIIGVGEGYREPLKKEGLKGDFFRLWGDYWNMWELKELEEIETFPGRVWGTNHFAFDYNTLEKNTITDLNAYANLDILNLGGFIIGPFVKGKINYAARKEPWYGFGEVGGGIRIRKGTFNLFLESGHRESFEGNGSAEGGYNTIYTGVWVPIIF